MNYIGMDIHKQFIVAVVKDEQGNNISQEKIVNDSESLKSFMIVYQPEETKIVMESTCVWEHIYEALESMCYEVKLANPVRTRAIAEARVKTDSVDANTLCDLLRANLISESYVPPKEIRQMREIVRQRNTLAKQRTQMKNKIHAVLLRRGIRIPTTTLCNSTRSWLLDQNELKESIAPFIRLLEQCETELEIVEEKIRTLAENNSNVKLLMTIPGVSYVRGLEIVAEIGDVNRFPSANKLCSYAGLVPGIRQSGNTLHFGGLIREASRKLKKVLIEASWTLTRTKESNPFQEFYKKLAKKKGKQKAICATARKLGCAVHAMLRKQREFMIL